MSAHPTRRGCDFLPSGLPPRNLGALKGCAFLSSESCLGSGWLPPKAISWTRPENGSRPTIPISPIMHRPSDGAGKRLWVKNREHRSSFYPHFFACSYFKYSIDGLSHRAWASMSRSLTRRSVFPSLGNRTCPAPKGHWADAARLTSAYVSPV